MGGVVLPLTFSGHCRADTQRTILNVRNSMLESRTMKHSDWIELSKRVTFQAAPFVDGKWLPSEGEAPIQSINPATGGVIAELVASSEADVERAVSIARNRFRQGAWSQMPARRRIDVLTRLADLIIENAPKFSVLDTLEMGKPVSEMMTIDVPGAALTFRFLAECIDKIGGECPSTDHGSLHYILRQPVGVVGAITPWNYPLMMAAWKAAPALAAGNSVVLKPSEESSLSSLYLAQLFVEAGGPEGVFNVVTGTGNVAGRALALSHGVDRLVFTGSTNVGRLIHKYAAESNLKRVSAELGGKSPQIVLADLGDIGMVAAKVGDALMGNQGEVCSAGSRILVAKTVYDEFCEALTAHVTRTYVPGDPLNPSTRMGPLVSKAHQKRVLGYVETARSEGAQELLGGGAHLTNPEACFVSPTLFGNVATSATIAREEIFGPVGAIIPHNGPEDAIAIANNSRYGLGAGIWTDSLSNAHTIARDLECGMVWINGYMNGDMTQPWGGWKESGEGKDKSMHALLENTQTKSVWVTLGN